MNLLSIQNLRKEYSRGIIALDDISLEIENGVFGLLGPNGSGKSTMMKLIVGLLRPSKGSIHFNENDIVENPRYIKQRVGYLPQAFGVYPGRSAFELLNHLAILKGVSDTKKRRLQINFLLDKTNLFDKRNLAVSTFSGGMKQRFGIAQALLGDPQIIVVDEPTAGLDPEERNKFNNLLSEIGENIIVILATHIVEDVRNVCSKMAIIHKGKLLQLSTPSSALETYEEKIWKKEILKREFEFYQNKYNVLSSQLRSGTPSIRIFSETHPEENFVSTLPILEDVYFHTLQNNDN